jgi:hypothetical protein
LRRLLSILFLAVLLFNFYGYRVMINCMQDQQARILTSKLDKKDYKESELISIKTSLHLPYYTSSSEYERAYGSVNFNGVDYEYVKRRVYNDTLELLCLPNDAKTKLQSAKNDITKMSVDGQPLQSNKKPVTILKINLPDYFQELSVSSSRTDAAFETKYDQFVAGYLPLVFASRPERPPQSMPLFV